MWLYWTRAEFERCIAICDEGIALAAQLASEPVQYPTLKALALMDLGHFGAAWDALQREVADERHPFGATMQHLGVAVYLQHLGAVDRAASAGLNVMAEARQLSRTWMQEWIVNLLTAICARIVDPELRARIDATLAATLFRPSNFALAEQRLCEGNPDEALALIGPFVHEADANGLRRDRIVALEAELRALAELGSWTDAARRADAVLEDAQAMGFRAMTWRILGHRARARVNIGNRAGAARDAEAARQILAALAESVPDPELRVCFVTDSLVREVLAMAVT
jgi:hypothetical protein